MTDPVSADLRASGNTPRPAPVDQEPGARLGQTLILLDEIDRAARRLQPLLRTVERMTGLSLAQVRTLMAFADDDQMPRGTTSDATTVTSLAHKGLVAPGDRTPGGGAGEAVVRLTDAGRAALEQVQGLRIRAVSTLVNALDDSQVDEIHASLRGIGEALEDLHPHTGRPQAVPGTGGSRTLAAGRTDPESTTVSSTTRPEADIES